MTMEKWVRVPETKNIYIDLQNKKALDGKVLTNVNMRAKCLICGVEFHINQGLHGKDQFSYYCENDRTTYNFIIRS